MGYLIPSKGFQLPPKPGNGFWDSDLYGPYFLVDGRELYLSVLLQLNLNVIHLNKVTS